MAYSRTNYNRKLGNRGISHHNTALGSLWYRLPLDLSAKPTSYKIRTSITWPAFGDPLSGEIKTRAQDYGSRVLSCAENGPRNVNVLSVGCHIKDNDPEKRTRILVVTAIDKTYVYAQRGMSDGSFKTRIKLDRVFTDDKLRRYGWSLTMEDCP